MITVDIFDNIGNTRDHNRLGIIHTMCPLMQTLINPAY